MGIGNLRPGEADFSPMTKDPHQLGISFIVQKTRIELDRKGTKAAAATAVTVKTESIAEPVREYKEVVCDRPYCYAIVDTVSMNPIFIGTVNNVV